MQYYNMIYITKKYRQKEWGYGGQRRRYPHLQNNYKGIYLNSSNSYTNNMKVYVYKVTNKKTLLNWGKELKQRKKEALQTLEEENVLAENITLFEVNGETYGVGIMVGNKGGIKKPNMNRKINKKHFKVLRESVGKPIKVKEVYTFKTLWQKYIK